jgi:hypothetical protein
VTFRAVRLDPVVSKTDLLFWDEIAVVGLRHKIDRLAEVDPAQAADLRFLIANKVVDDRLPATLRELDSYIDNLNIEPVRVLFTISGSSVTPSAGTGHAVHQGEDQAELAEGFEQLIANCEQKAGGWSIPLVTRRAMVGVRGRLIARVLRGPEGVIVAQPVVDLIIRQLPIPSPRVSLERILDFRSESRAQRQLEQLRGWIANAVADDRPIPLIEAELRSLLADFQAHMHLRRLETGWGTVQGLFGLAGGIVEDLTRMRFGKASERLATGIFSISVRRVELLKSELEAPGRALAYIDTAERAFDNRGSTA